MADITLTITIPDAKVARAKEGFLYARPKEDGFVGTDKEWFEEVVRRFVTITVRNGLVAKAQADEQLEDDYTTGP